MCRKIKIPPLMHEVPDQDTMKSETLPHLSVLKRGYDPKKCSSGSYSMRSSQVENRLSMAYYVCVFTMLLPLYVSSMPCNRSRWLPQAYLFSLPLLTRACSLRVCFVWFLVRNLT